MPFQKRRAGKSTYELANKRFLRGLFGGIAILILGFILYKFVSNPDAIKGAGGFVSLAAILLLMVLPDILERFLNRSEKEEKRAIRGAEAEEDVEDTLIDLESTTCHVFHDIKSPYGNIDHIVINQGGGVFLIETKSHRGRVSARNGELLLNNHPPEKNFINQVLGNSYWMKERIEAKTNMKAWVVPVIVFTNAFVERTNPIKGVNIINRKFLLAFIINNHSTSPGGRQFWIQWEQRSS